MEFRATFFFGNGTESWWLHSIDMLIVFLLSLCVEWLSHTRFLSEYSSSNRLRAGLVQTGLYVVRTTMVYLVMLAVMSFNVGILVAAVTGYGVGFLVLGSRVFERVEVGSYEKPSDIPPLNC